MYRDAHLRAWVSCDYAVIQHSPRAGVQFYTPHPLEQMFYSVGCPLQINEITVCLAFEEEHFWSLIQVRLLKSLYS